MMIDEHHLDDLAERIQIFEIKFQEYKDSITESKYQFSNQQFSDLEKKITFKERQLNALNMIFKQELQWLYELEESFDGTGVMVIVNLLDRLEESVRRLQQSTHESFNSDDCMLAEELHFESSVYCQQSTKVCDSEVKRLATILNNTMEERMNEKQKMATNRDRCNERGDYLAVNKEIKDYCCNGYQIGQIDNYLRYGHFSTVWVACDIKLMMDACGFGLLKEAEFEILRRQRKKLMSFYCGIVKLIFWKFNFGMLKEYQLEIWRRQRLKISFSPMKIYVCKVFVKMLQPITNTDHNININTILEVVQFYLKLRMITSNTTDYSLEQFSLQRFVKDKAKAYTKTNMIYSGKSSFKPYIALEQLKTLLESSAPTSNHENLHSSDGASSHGKPLIPPTGLLLVIHETSFVNAAPGYHKRANTMRAYSVGVKEVDPLLPDTVMSRVQLRVTMPAKASRKVDEEVNSMKVEPCELYDGVLYMGIIDILQEFFNKKEICKSLSLDKVVFFIIFQDSEKLQSHDLVDTVKQMKESIGSKNISDNSDTDQVTILFI